MFCDSFRRSATVLRSRVIATISSRAALWRGPDGWAGALAGLEARASSAPSMSPLVTRPSRPVPATEAVERPLSAAMRCADGMAGASDFAAGTGAGAGAGAAAFGASAFAAGLAAAPALPSAIAPSKAPTTTVSPALTEMDSSAPSAGAGTSTVTLSVSSSSSGSSRLTASPSFLNQRATVASVTDSPIAGTLISVLMNAFRPACRAPSF